MDGRIKIVFYFKPNSCLYAFNICIRRDFYVGTNGDIFNTDKSIEYILKDAVWEAMSRDLKAPYSHRQTGICTKNVTELCNALRLQLDAPKKHDIQRLENELLLPFREANSVSFQAHIANFLSIAGELEDQNCAVAGIKQFMILETVASSSPTYAELFKDFNRHTDYLQMHQKTVANLRTFGILFLDNLPITVSTLVGGTVAAAFAVDRNAVAYAYTNGYQDPAMRHANAATRAHEGHPSYAADVDKPASASGAKADKTSLYCFLHGYVGHSGQGAPGIRCNKLVELAQAAKDNGQSDEVGIIRQQMAAKSPDTLVAGQRGKDFSHWRGKDSSRGRLRR